MPDGSLMLQVSLIIVDVKSLLVQRAVKIIATGTQNVMTTLML